MNKEILENIKQQLEMDKERIQERVEADGLIPLVQIHFLPADEIEEAYNRLEVAYSIPERRNALAYSDDLYKLNDMIEAIDQEIENLTPIYVIRKGSQNYAGGSGFFWFQEDDRLKEFKPGDFYTDLERAKECARVLADVFPQITFNVYRHQPESDFFPFPLFTTAKRLGL
jgi:hypothetical protein